MIVPKEKSAVFWRFLSLCPQFDPYLLRGCDGGGAVHKKVAPKLGEFRCDRMRDYVQNERVGRLSHLFELLHLREDEDERKEAEGGKYTPYIDEGNSTPKHSRDHSEEVTDGSSHEPTTHHHTLVLGRSHFRYKGNTHGRKEKLSKSEHEVGINQDLRAHSVHLLPSLDSCFLSIGCFQTDRGSENDAETNGSNEHTISDFARSRGLETFLVQPSEERNANGGETNDKAGIELLEDRCANFY